MIRVIFKSYEPDDEHHVLNWNDFSPGYQPDPLQAIAEYLTESPELFEGYMKICFTDLNDLVLEYDTPSEGILLVTRHG